MCHLSQGAHTPYTRGIPWVKSPERVRLTGGRACWRERGHSYRPKVTLRDCKTSVSYETSSKSHASSLKNERFVRDFLQKSHVKSPKQAFRTRLPPKVTCQVPKTRSNAHKVLRLPRNVTSVTHRNLTIPCACHENPTSTPQNPHKVLRLPRKVTMSSHVSFNKNLHHTTRLE